MRYAGKNAIEGAFVECGTYTGGASAFALLSMMRNEPSTPRRQYWGFDSFEGMPKPTTMDGARAAAWLHGKKVEELKNEDVSGALTGHSVNLANYDACLKFLQETGYPASRIELVKGWFQNTLPGARNRIGPIAILRMDADFYESTMSILENLYDQVTPRGAVIIDDYGSFEGCKKAVHEFLAGRGQKPHIHYVDNGVHYFIKPQ